MANGKSFLKQKTLKTTSPHKQRQNQKSLNMNQNNSESPTPSREETALLAGGCFWGMQDLIRKQQGVITTTVGYTGGTLENPTYNHVKTGSTGHTEAIEIKFDPELISYRDLLAYFFQIHDPTTHNRQGNDIGTQYRSAIFYTNDIQRDIAEALIKELNQSGIWPNPITTEVVKATPFWPAEQEHQDYLERFPTGYTCHFERPDWKL